MSELRKCSIWRRIGAIVAFLVTTLLCRPAEAATTVTVEGKTVVIHVPIDARGLRGITVKDPATGKVIDAATYVEREVGRIWNEAFEGFSYECWKFRLDLKILPVGRDAKSTRGHHEVIINTLKDHSEWDPTGPDDMVPDRDFPFAYSRDMRGVFNTPDPQILSHEIGHALGLGDDYFKKGGNKPEARGIGERAGGVDSIDQDGNVVGRGSFMTSGVGGPDAVHLWRVVAMMKEAGVLPQCRWVGTIKVQAVGNVYDEEGELAFAFTESKDGSVNGSAHFRRTANRPKPWINSCTYTRTYSTDEADLPITGRREGDHFTLTMDPRTAMGTQTFSAKCEDGGGSTGSVAAILLGPLAGFAARPLAVEAKDGVINHFLHETFNDIATDATIELHDTKKIASRNGQATLAHRCDSQSDCRHARSARWLEGRGQAPEL